MNRIILKKLRQIRKKFQKYVVMYFFNISKNREQFLNQVKLFSYSYNIIHNKWFHNNYHKIILNTYRQKQEIDKIRINKQNYGKNYISKKSIIQSNNILYSNNSSNPLFTPNRKIDQQFYNRNNESLQYTKRYSIITGQIPQLLNIHAINRNLKQLVDVNVLYASSRNLLLINQLRKGNLEFNSITTDKQGKIKLDNQGNPSQEVTTYKPNILKLITNYNRMIPTFTKSQLLQRKSDQLLNFYNRHIPHINRESFVYLDKDDNIKYKQKSKILYFCDIKIDKKEIYNKIEAKIPENQNYLFRYNNIYNIKENSFNQIDKLKKQSEKLNVNNNTSEQYYDKDYLILKSLSNNNINIQIPNSFVSVNMDYSLKWTNNFYIGNLLPIGTYNGVGKVLNFQVTLINSEKSNQILLLQKLIDSLIPNRGKHNQFIGNIFQITFFNKTYYGILKDINRSINNSQTTWLGDGDLNIDLINHYILNLTFNLIDKEIKNDS